MHSNSEALTISELAPTACSICGERCLKLLGSKDFGISGSDYFIGNRTFKDYGVLIPYFECQQCFFVFTNAFDNWTDLDWRQHVYNDGYVLADPPFVSERPCRNAQLIEGLFHRELPTLSILDIGSGSGKMSDALKAKAKQVVSWDPHYCDESVSEQQRFDLITSFECVEHVPHHRQLELAESFARKLLRTPSARILFSTELQSTASNLDWWYICPRNGHISIHSRQSLSIMMSRFHLSLVSINPSMHISFWKSDELDVAS